MRLVSVVENAGALKAQRRSGSTRGCSRPIGATAGRSASGCATLLSQRRAVNSASGASPVRRFYITGNCFRNPENSFKP
jgi:hypothetical protein